VEKPQSAAMLSAWRGRIGWLGLLLFALLLRGGALAWQPLWWDEGYSVYFATEPLTRLLALTAADIHPPLYYVLLQGWLALTSWLHPANLRILSVLFGVLSVPIVWKFAAALFPDRPRIAWLATMLLVINPLHLYYSQEIRMYGLALLLGTASTWCLWRLFEQMQQRNPVGRAMLAYALVTALSLYTLYYLSLLFVAHALWMVWQFREQWRRLLPLVGAYLLGALFFAPWLIYAIPQLIPYITQKVSADADQPLGPLLYLWQHSLAFVSGHLPTMSAWGEPIRWLGMAAVLVLFTSYLLRERRNDQREVEDTAHDAPFSLLWSCVLIPSLLGFLINLHLPFFPSGGERLLLFALPYFLILLAAALDRIWAMRPLLTASLLGLFLAAGVGIWTFYTVPRYEADDYRPLIRQIVQQGSDEDTILAIFPWEVGYWRLYAAVTACASEPITCRNWRGDGVNGPTVHLLDDRAVRWGPDVAALIDQLLTRGTLWFAAPLALGSTLPPAIETHLAQHAVNVENRWFTPTTRLSAWRTLAAPPRQPNLVDFGRVQLLAHGIDPQPVVAANQPLAIQLQWQADSPTTDLGVTLRLRDASGYTWASRAYAPLGSLAQEPTAAPLTEQAALLIPAGLPPAIYELALGVVISATQQLLPPVGSDRAATELISLGSVTVEQPSSRQPAYRLPIQQPLTPPPVIEGTTWLGYAGNHLGAELLAGQALNLTLFLQQQAPNPTERQLFVSLLDGAGNGVAGWEGESPSGWPPTAWPADALIQAPIAFFTPPTLGTGSYRLIAGWLDPSSGTKSQPIPLGTVQVQQREHQFEPPEIPQPLADPVQFGTHVRLLGYQQVERAEEQELLLYWQVMQTLLSHHLFVHLVGENGEILAQIDGPPITLAGPAPSETWLPDEYLVTQHKLNADLPPGTTAWLVGVYEPNSGVRLPASQQGQAIGDTAVLSVLP
jgi:hypothetical protein